MHLGMLSIFGFVHLAAGPVRAASESTGVFRKYGLQLGMLWIFGLLHLASRPGVYRRTEEISYAPWDAFDLWLCTPCRWACPSSFGVYRRIQEIWSAAWDALVRVRNAVLWLNSSRGAVLKRLISSMPRRVEACVEVKGALTPY